PLARGPPARRALLWTCARVPVRAAPARRSSDLTTVTLLGLALIEKSSGTVTVSETEVLCVAEAPVAVTVRVSLPTGVDVTVLIVIDELHPAVTVLGLQGAAAPAGSPLAPGVIARACR